MILGYGAENSKHPYMPDKVYVHQNMGYKYKSWRGLPISEASSFMVCGHIQICPLMWERSSKLIFLTYLTTKKTEHCLDSGFRKPHLTHLGMFANPLRKCPIRLTFWVRLGPIKVFPASSSCVINCSATWIVWAVDSIVSEMSMVEEILNRTRNTQ